MDINKMLAELRLEREQIEEAIMTLERLARGRGRRRGRPPAWMSQIKRRGRPPGSKNRPKNEPKGSRESRRRLRDVRPVAVTEPVLLLARTAGTPTRERWIRVHLSRLPPNGTAGTAPFAG